MHLMITTVALKSVQLPTVYFLRGFIPASWKHSDTILNIGNSTTTTITADNPYDITQVAMSSTVNTVLVIIRLDCSVPKIKKSTIWWTRYTQ